jgi:hypothetical protein
MNVTHFITIFLTFTYRTFREYRSEEDGLSSAVDMTSCRQAGKQAGRQAGRQAGSKRHLIFGI